MIFPFIIQKINEKEKKKEWQPEYLYKEIEKPILIKKDEDQNEEEDSSIIIQL